MSTLILLKLLLKKGKLTKNSIVSNNKTRKAVKNCANSVRFKNNADSELLNVGSFEAICRLCRNKSESGMIPLFNESSNANIGIIAKLLENVSIEKNDGLPQNICHSCFKLLGQVKEFKYICEETDKLLRVTLHTNTERNSFTEKEYSDSNLDSEIDDEFNVDKSISEISINEDNPQTVLNLESSTNAFDDCLANIKYKVPLRQFDDLFCEKCQLKFDSHEKFTSHSLSDEHITKRWSCIDCNKDFNRRADYEIHRRSHTHEKPYVCEMCGRGFSYNCSFRNHMLVHKKLFPFKCSICSHRARNTWAIKVHERIHTGERPHACPHCPATFTTSSNCKRHVTKHFDLRPHKCEQCDKSFASKQYLHDHKATVHDNLKMYKCSQCDLTMGFKRSLRKHELKTHQSKKKTDREESFA